MREERVIEFRVTDERGPNGRHIDVVPTLINIYRSDGGDDIILAIAANCLRAIAQKEGLERALDRLTDSVINKTSFIRE